ncbi:MAG: hypothetical protein E7266_08225 [Lachnospiraceae bacterium]|nr:hypothetical protein [Lachnospiraceae bacterium]
MVCTKCGGEYDNTFDKCPYCGEIFQIPGSDKKKKEKVYGKNVRKLARTLHITEELSEKILKVVPYVIGFFAALLCVFVIYKYFSGVGSKEYRQFQKNLNVLEERYEAKDYKGIYEKISAIDNIDKYNEYICYYSISEMYLKGKEYLESEKSAAEAFASDEKEIIGSNVKKALKSLAAVYNEKEALTVQYSGEEKNDKYIDEVLVWFVEKAVNTYKLSEAEVYEVMSEGYDDETVIDSYVDVVFRRVWSTGNAFVTDDGIDTEDTTESGKTEEGNEE